MSMRTDLREIRAVRQAGRAGVAVAAVAVLAAGLGGAPASAAYRASGARAAAGLSHHRPAPFGRVWESWAYDPSHGHSVVLFGGDTGPGTTNAGIALGRTWTWNGTRWRERHLAVVPSPRAGAAMVFDPATHQMLLFGGSQLPGTAGGFLGDTWSWNGSRWTRLHPATSPSARHNADMIYDAARHEVLLFGGYNGGYLGDTWTWNGSTWTRLSTATSPSPRDGDTLVYDPATRTAILFGGFNDGGRLGDTWSWNGRTWTMLHPPASPGILTTSWQGGYDAASGQLVIFGGDFGGPFSDATWTWNGTTWIHLHPARFPAARAYGAITYDRALCRLILFGGSTASGTDPRVLWEWTGTTWQRAPARISEEECEMPGPGITGATMGAGRRAHPAAQAARRRNRLAGEPHVGVVESVPWFRQT